MPYLRSGPEGLFMNVSNVSSFMKSSLYITLNILCNILHYLVVRKPTGSRRSNVMLTGKIKSMHFSELVNCLVPITMHMWQCSDRT